MKEDAEKPNAAPPPAAGTRDAVESSIDLVKSDKCRTWEESAELSLTKISRWDDTKKRPSPPGHS